MTEPTEQGVAERMDEVNQAELRALVYRFLATLYLAAPAPAWLVALLEEGLLDEFPVPAASAPMAEGLALIRGECQRLAEEPNLEEAGRALVQEHNRLFVGPGHLPVPPWESVYRSRERLLFDWPTLQVREAYREMGLQTATRSEPDDHVGLELLFMALLCEREAQGDSEARAAQRRFLDEHLNQWLPTFCADLFAHAEVPLYRGLARLTEGFLAQERALA